MENLWNGVYPAITTKFKDDQTLDLEKFTNNIDSQIEAGVDGIILGGSLGEASTLTEKEKYHLLEHSLSHVAGQVPVILNIAEQATFAAVDMARHAEKAGAQGIMLLPPMRYKADDRETVKYFTDVAAATALPVMIYNNPVDYKIFVSLDMFEELAKYPNINAVKDSTRDTTNVTRMINRFGDRYKILCGVDTLAMESLLMGADGWVAGLVAAFPRETVVLYKLMKQNRTAEARQLFRWFLPLLELDIHPKLVQYIKLAESRTGLGSEHVRAPRLVLEGEERTKILKIIDHGIASRPELPKVE